MSPAKATEVVLAVLAAKTGYEPDMIEMDMALETELGVDSIKRVEILSDVQKELNVEAQDVAALSRTQTVGEVVEAMIKELGSAPAAVSANAFSVMPTPSTPQSMKVAEPAVPSMALKNKDFDQADTPPPPPPLPRSPPAAPSPPARRHSALPPHADALPPSRESPALPALPPAPPDAVHPLPQELAAATRAAQDQAAAASPTAARRRRCSRSATRSSPSSRSR